ncbi:UNKNOWN [Stylonychia lemnae]|uniref:Uncharacterized protein n=1 Tax=Stylonychia lemnae TaxID=5949 RepID=A0A078B775_STYLE|nr:UNKNOWN [Stylonychia lemnae]|eukprot:CDW90259.1 UNKNOWN [Stylonychia lemnae]
MNERISLDFYDFTNIEKFIHIYNQATIREIEQKEKKMMTFKKIAFKSKNDRITLNQNGLDLWKIEVLLKNSIQIEFNKITFEIPQKDLLFEEFEEEIVQMMNNGSNDVEKNVISKVQNSNKVLNQTLIIKSISQSSYKYQQNQMYLRLSQLFRNVKALILEDSKDFFIRRCFDLIRFYKESEKSKAFKNINLILKKS